VFFALLVHNLFNVPNHCFSLCVMRVFCAVHMLTLNVLVVVPLLEMMRLDNSTMREPFHEEPVVSAVAVM
jgi:riboflavin transporter FmnP